MIADDISNWILTLPKWQQKLSYLIMEKKHISEEKLNGIYDVFKTETKLQSGKISEDIEKVCNVNLENSPNVIWQGVGNLHGVNKLKSNSELNVSSGLTVIYGENGSGKSGYTRLLNNAFISRGDQDILPNIFENKPEQVSADFKFSIDGNNIEYKYPDDKDAYAFKTIRNFDAKSAADDMNKESKIDFAPSELSFFDKFLSACLEIQKRLDDEIEEKKMDNPVLKYFPNDGSALSQMKELTAKTEINDIRERFGITDDEKERYEQIKKEKANLVALDINRQISLINQVLLFLSEAEKKYALYENITSNENIKIYNQQIKFLQKSKIIYESDGIALFEKDDIEQLGTKECKEFINSAKKYYDKINNHEKCPLCGQKVDGDDLLFKYWKFLESDAENNYNIAKEAIRISKEGLKDLNLIFLVGSSVQEQWLTENYKSETDRIRYCFAQISLGMLNPDLVIMDEFQRFKDLIEIDENDYSDSAMLSKKFLKDNTDSCVLLLSATPYKPFSTLSEFTDGEETHINGFMRVMDFLVNGENENARFHKVWDSYTEHLSEIKGNNLSVLIASKDEAETELHNHMCRTERRDAGIINTDKARAMSIDNLSPANISSYIELQTIMHDLSIGNFPIDYVKSAPYLMSFMNYKVKEKIDNKLRDEKQQISIADRARYIKRMQVAFLKRTQINGYQQLPNTNARLNTLFNEVFRPTEKKKMSPELLLWIPPANKYYECGPQNIFEQCDGYSKTLVFSSWEMVPRVIAILTSYEAERLVNNRIGNKSIEQQSYYAVPESDEMNDDDNPKKNKRGKTRFLIREQRKLVAYPSIWLAGLYDGKKY